MAQNTIFTYFLIIGRERDHMKQLAKKELDRINEVMSSIELASDSPKALEFMQMIQAYYKDGLHFYEKSMWLEAFESFVYTWGWLDAGARMEFFKIPKKVRKHFKIEQ